MTIPRKHGKRAWLVVFDGCREYVYAKQAGGAARLGLRAMLQKGRIKRQPRSVDGWFAGVSVELLKD